MRKHFLAFLSFIVVLLIIPSGVFAAPAGMDAIAIAIASEIRPGAAVSGQLL